MEIGNIQKKQEGLLDVAYFTSDRLSYMTFYFAAKDKLMDVNR